MSLVTDTKYDFYIKHLFPLADQYTLQKPGWFLLDYTERIKYQNVPIIAQTYIE